MRRLINVATLTFGIRWKSAATAASIACPSRKSDAGTSGPSPPAQTHSKMKIRINIARRLRRVRRKPAVNGGLYNEPMSYRDILGSSGTIAQRLENFETRPQQLDMAEAVADALAKPGHLMVEAGTGVGKSFAYLVPAIQKACATKDYRVVISTHTISLQEQLIRKDIPFLQSVMPEKFSALLVKGRGNYMSKRRLKVAHERSLSLLSEPGAERQLDTLMAWDKITKDGSRSDLDFGPCPRCGR